MDEHVLKGMARWPDVPAVYGWLALDRRGNWLLKGERIMNPLVTAFIGRNYGADAAGCWFFQNGPQRVYVDLDYAPLVCRLVDEHDFRFADHTGALVEPRDAYLDEEGSLLINTARGLALVHDADLPSLVGSLIDRASGRPLNDEELAARLQDPGSYEELAFLATSGRKLMVYAVTRKAAPSRFGYVERPSAVAGTTP